MSSQQYIITVNNRSYLQRFSDCEFDQFVITCFSGSEQCGHVSAARHSGMLATSAVVTPRAFGCSCAALSHSAPPVLPAVGTWLASLILAGDACFGLDITVGSIVSRFLLTPAPSRSEQFQLWFSEKLVVFQYPQNLEDIGFLVIAVGLDLLDKVGEHRPERQHGVHTLVP